MHSNTVLISGLPRSGTTLCCWLINKTGNSVALNEPMPVHELMGNSRIDNLAFTEQWLLQQRESIRRTGTATMKQSQSHLPSNSYGQDKNEAGLRYSFVEPGEIYIEKPLSDDFLLAVKHNGAYCALLPALSQQYVCLGIVRNPLAVLLSWHSLDIPVRTGQMPVAQSLDPELDQALSLLSNVPDKQLYILNWFFRRFSEYLPPQHILRYETIVESGGKALFAALRIHNDTEIQLQNKNINSYYPTEVVEQYAHMLLENQRIYTPFYSKEDIQHLAQQYCRI